jgi:Fe-S-cluster containining protein
LENKPVCSECIKTTGGCCVEVEFSIHKSEVTIFLAKQRNGELPSGHSLKFDDSDDTYTYSSGEGRCTFLSDENKCSIYETRPLMCRMYPVLWQQRKKMLSYYLDMSCPLAHRMPLREFISWPNRNENNRQISQMNDLDFNHKDEQYISLTVISQQPETSLAMNPNLLP